MADMPKIEKNVPVPPRGTNKGARWGNSVLWAKMEPGDSVFLAGYNQALPKGVRMPNMKAFNLGHVRKAFPSATWTSRTVEENGVKGIRVWRVS